MASHRQHAGAPRSAGVLLGSWGATVDGLLIAVVGRRGYPHSSYNTKSNPWYSFEGRARLVDDSFHSSHRTTHPPDIPRPRRLPRAPAARLRVLAAKPPAYLLEGPKETRRCENPVGDELNAHLGD